ncbi:MAG: serine/threonine-protein phosphatase [Planctomyces sp.]|nr:serine/threonine-protein phosphatase [Planctomyces sp.]
MNEQPVVQYSSKTDVGMRRSANQDSLQIRMCSGFEEWQKCGYLFVVADGMGGHSVGDLASKEAVEALVQNYFRLDAEDVLARMQRSVAGANRAVHEKGRQNPEFSDMGTTCSALSLSERGAIIGHVGDSRVYLIRNAQIAQLTFDHSLQWEMIRLGRATAKNVDLFHPRNVITRCLGPDPNVRVDLEGPFQVVPGDRFLLCSDGLTNHVSDSEIGQIAGSLPPTDAAKLLINLANCRGGSDNTTVVVVQVDDYPIQPEGTLNPLMDRSRLLDQTIVDVPLKSSASSRAALLFTMASAAFGISFFALGRPVAGAILCLTAFASALFDLFVLRPARFRGMTLDTTQKPVSDTDKDDIDLVVNHGAANEGEGLPLNSPYRQSTAELRDGLLDHLAEIQGELVQAARDSGWNVDFDNLTSLSRQAVASQQAGKRERSITFRARAIDLLMKELYARKPQNRSHP